MNQRSERRSAYGFDGQAAGSRLADDTEIESLVESLTSVPAGRKAHGDSRPHWLCKTDCVKRLIRPTETFSRD